MKRLIPLPAILAIALTIAVFLPLYVERTMTRVLYAHGGGGRVDWGWKRCSLREYRADYDHLDREQDPAFWLGVNVGLALFYAGVISFSINRAVRALK